MNCNQAKEIQLKDLLQRMGFNPVKSERGGSELKYISPFRNEHDASFNLNIVKNSWMDFGLGQGGNTLDFAIEYLKTIGRPSRVSDALEWLSHQMNIMPFDQSAIQLRKDLLSPIEESGDEEVRQLVFIQALPINSKQILHYLEAERAISESLAKKYLRLVQYSNTKIKRTGDKPFYGFGIQNRSGGWEIRAASSSHGFKSALIKRDITFIKGGSHNTVHVFEGMLDFLSYLELEGRDSPESDVIILHSLSSFSLCEEFIKCKDYNQINTWLDNDDSGRRGLERFRFAFPDRIIDRSSLYMPYKDVNKYLVSNRGDEIKEISKPALS